MFTPDTLHLMRCLLCVYCVDNMMQKREGRTAVDLKAMKIRMTE